MTSKDTISLRYLKIVAAGPPNTGKSTTVSRLVKQFSNLLTAGDKGKRRSTLLANCTQVLAFVGEDQSDWLASTDDDDEAQLIISYLFGCESIPKANEEPSTTTVSSTTLSSNEGQLLANSSSTETPGQQPSEVNTKPSVTQEPSEPTPGPRPYSPTERRAAAYQ